MKHLEEVRMTYFDHLIFAWKISIVCFGVGIILIVHGILPCFFERTGSDIIEELNKLLNRTKHE